MQVDNVEGETAVRFVTNWWSVHIPKHHDGYSVDCQRESKPFGHARLSSEQDIEEATGKNKADDC